MTPANIPSPTLPRIYLIRLSGLFILGLSIGLVTFTLTFVRPFFDGFDLNSIAREDGIQTAEFFTADGQQIQHRLSGVTAYFFNGEHRGRQIDLDRLEQGVTAAQPQLQGLAISADGDLPEGLILSDLRARPDGQGFEAREGVTGSYAGNAIEADAVFFDPITGTLTTEGQTRIRNGGFEILSQDGAEISRNGDIRIGPQRTNAGPNIGNRGGQNP